MTALTADRNTPSRSGDVIEFTVYGTAATTIYAGSLVCITSTGLAVPAGHAQAMGVVGRAEKTVVNPLNGALTIEVRRGVFRFANQGLTRAYIGLPVAVVDDQTVQLCAPGEQFAGTLVDVDADGAWVAVGFPRGLATAANVVGLTGSLTGTPNGEMENIAAAAGACAGGSSPTAGNVDAAIATAVAPIVTGTNLQLKELQMKLNATLAALKNVGLMVADS